MAPGFSFAALMRSGSVLNGLPDGTSSTKGASISFTTGVKSFAS